jgi:hypothetical protein
VKDFEGTCLGRDRRRKYFVPRDGELSLKKLSILEAFAKVRKAAIIFVISVCLSFRMGQLFSSWSDFHEILYIRSKCVPVMYVPLSCNSLLLSGAVQVRISLW